MEYEKFKNEFLRTRNCEKNRKVRFGFRGRQILVARSRCQKNDPSPAGKKNENQTIGHCQSGKRRPSAEFEFLKKLADVYGTDLVPPKFKCMEESPVILKYEQNISTNNGLQTKSTLADWGDSSGTKSVLV